MKCIIGVIGAQGSGKSTFVELLRNRLGVPVEAFKSSGVLLEVCQTLRIANPKRERLQTLAVQLEGMGSGTLAHAMRERLAESSADVAVFDGVRWDVDVAVIRSFPLHALVYIKRSARKRFHGMKLRKEKVGENFLTWKQFQKEESAPTEIMIPRIGKQADVIIDNGGTLDDYALQVENFYKNFETVLA